MGTKTRAPPHWNDRWAFVNYTVYTHQCASGLCLPEDTEPWDGHTRSFIHSFIHLLFCSVSKYFSANFIPDTVSHIGRVAVDRPTPWAHGAYTLGGKTVTKQTHGVPHVGKWFRGNISGQGNGQWVRGVLFLPRSVKKKRIVRPEQATRISGGRTFWRKIVNAIGLWWAPAH